MWVVVLVVGDVGKSELSDALAAADSGGGGGGGVKAAGGGGGSGEVKAASSGGGGGCGGGYGQAGGADESVGTVERASCPRQEAASGWEWALAQSALELLVRARAATAEAAANLKLAAMLKTFFPAVLAFVPALLRSALAAKAMSPT
eukprot:CAMPEP_0180019952 /NCGR_PEP_ID=MMETSP0984-20121128/21419_1 /TAXON_ID=483367 /ORGANISM="non described non described, Strain CCMP 2436" /LENGTH=146 /DNA_ID=CAMNT_0021943597 /DNA_START=147 /DNA_END=585 /DNA_ORIENTATION=+